MLSQAKQKWKNKKMHKVYTPPFLGGGEMERNPKFGAKSTVYVAGDHHWIVLQIKACLKISGFVTDANGMQRGE